MVSFVIVFVNVLSVFLALINDSFRTAFFNMLRPVLKPCTKYISVSPDQRNTHTTYSFTMNVVSL